MRTQPNLPFERVTPLIVLVAALSLSVTLGAQTAAVVARDAWVRVPAPSKMETSLYLTLENHGPMKRAVVSVSSEAADTCEMHEMKMVKTMMVMTPLSQIAIPANGKTSLDPNGLHIMMFGLKTKLAVGDKLTVTLRLDDGTTVPVEATVRK